MPLGEFADAGLRLVRFGARRRIGLPAVDEPFTLGGCARLEWTWDRFVGISNPMDRWGRSAAYQFADPVESGRMYGFVAF